jgi:hypothetical protein
MHEPCNCRTHQSGNGARSIWVVSELILENISLHMWEVIPSKAVATLHMPRKYIPKKVSRGSFPSFDLSNFVPVLTTPPIMIRPAVGGLHSTMSELTLSGLGHCLYGFRCSGGANAGLAPKGHLRLYL